MSGNGRRRVVVTGLGLVTPIGIGREATWEAAVEGRSGAGPITHFDPSEHVTKFACEVKGFDPTDYMDRKAAKRMDRFAQLAVAAAGEALEPHQVAQYLRELAHAFHTWYHGTPVLVDDAAERDAKLALAQAARQVLANGLDILGVGAPEKM